MIDPCKITSRYRLVLLKTENKGGQECGKLLVLQGADVVYSAVTIQKANILPDGQFHIEPYMSPKSGKLVLLFKDVPGHSYLEIHIGNFLKDTDGCVCPGKFFADLNHDKVQDVACSAETMQTILIFIKEPTTITVKTV